MGAESCPARAQRRRSTPWQPTAGASRTVVRSIWDSPRGCAASASGEGEAAAVGRQHPRPR
eukprot:8160165-Alexandrium_andersonii.AAC.1